jgi:hypothetical protein
MYDSPKKDIKAIISFFYDRAGPFLSLSAVKKNREMKKQGKI